MASAKSVFEHPTVSESSPVLSKKASKWDKPKPVPPPAVNHLDPDTQEPSADPELPPPAYTKNMLAVFQSMQQSDGSVTKDSDVHSSQLKKVDRDLSLCMFICLLLCGLLEELNHWLFAWVAASTYSAVSELEDYLMVIDT